MNGGGLGGYVVSASFSLPVKSGGFSGKQWNGGSVWKKEDLSVSLSNGHDNHVQRLAQQTADRPTDSDMADMYEVC